MSEGEQTSLIVKRKQIKNHNISFLIFQTQKVETIVPRTRPFSHGGMSLIGEQFKSVFKNSRYAGGRNGEEERPLGEGRGRRREALWGKEREVNTREGKGWAK